MSKHNNEFKGWKCNNCPRYDKIMMNGLCMICWHNKRGEDVTELEKNERIAEIRARTNKR